jgi:hypothetical protein
VNPLSSGHVADLLDHDNCPHYASTLIRERVYVGALVRTDFSMTRLYLAIDSRAEPSGYLSDRVR